MTHADEARRLISATSTKDWNDPSPYVDRRIAAAQVHATLALVDQLRAANLIALDSSTFKVDGRNAHLEGAIRMEDEKFVLHSIIAAAINFGDES